MERGNIVLTPVRHVWSVRRRIGCGLVGLALVLAGVRPAVADDALETKQLVEKARFTVENFGADPNLEAFRDLVKKAKGVFIAPEVFRAAFIIGASGGSGVFLALDASTGKWSEPAFYTVGSVSFGFQAGADASEVVLLAMTERGVTAMLGSTLKLGADASIAVGPVGIGAAAATAGLSADIIAFSRSKGIYGGVSLAGSVVATRDGWNSVYYGKSVTPTDILIRRNVSNPQSTGLVETITKASSAK